MKNLTLEETARYIKIVTKGNYDDMFDFAFNLGWKKAMEFSLQEAEKFAKELK